MNNLTECFSSENYIQMSNKSRNVDIFRYSVYVLDFLFVAEETPKSAI